MSVDTQKRLDDPCRAKSAELLDLPFESDARRLQDPRPHRLAEQFDVVAARGSSVDQEITVHFRHLRSADGQAPASGLINQFPGPRPRRIGECRPTGLFPDWLR